MKSILQTEKECFECKSTYNLHLHHIYFGTANRKISDKNGFVVYLCQFHHTGDYGVHGKYGKKRDKLLKQCCQLKYEHLGHSRASFIKLIGKSYL